MPDITLPPALRQLYSLGRISHDTLAGLSEIEEIIAKVGIRPALAVDSLIFFDEAGYEAIIREMEKD